LHVSLDGAEVVEAEVLATADVGQVATCAVDNGGCGDSAYWLCTEQAGGAPTCVDIDECATDNGFCGDTSLYACQNNPGGPPGCIYLLEE
jgi:hypothetical protein